MNILTNLFISFLKIGSFSIGGGYAIIPFIEKEIVNIKNWITIKEFTDIITISQMTPGPLAINTASFVGLKVGGIKGAFLASIGCVFSGFIFSIVLYKFFYKYRNLDTINIVLDSLYSTSIGLIISATMSIISVNFLNNPSFLSFSNINFNNILIFIISLYFLRKYKINPITIMILTGLIGLIP